jgi:hypothetical protein
MTTKVDGTVRSTVSSPTLCHSLLDIYLGPDPVSHDAKQSFGEGLATLLAEAK